MGSHPAAHMVYSPFYNIELPLFIVIVIVTFFFGIRFVWLPTEIFCLWYLNSKPGLPNLPINPNPMPISFPILYFLKR